MPTLDPFSLLIAALACFRMALMVSSEEGPFGVFQRLRGRLDPDQRTWVGRGINCVWCVSFWAAPVALLLTLYAPPAAWWLAVSGAVVAGHMWLTRRR